MSYDLNDAQPQISSDIIPDSSRANSFGSNFLGSIGGAWTRDQAVRRDKATALR